MGNCQAAEAATVVIQHPGNKIERVYWSVSAHQVMSSNPGYYVANVVTSPSTSAAESSEKSLPVKQLKLLRPDDTLVIGQVYRLVSFEDVVKLGKKSVKLGKLLKETRANEREKPLHDPLEEEEQEELVMPGRSTSTVCGSGGGGGQYGGVGRQYGNAGQWRPALQTIAELEVEHRTKAAHPRRSFPLFVGRVPLAL